MLSKRVGDKSYIWHNSIYTEFKKKAELFYPDRSQNSGHLWVRVSIRKGHKGIFRNVGNVFLCLGGSFTDAKICKNFFLEYKKSVKLYN